MTDRPNVIGRRPKIYRSLSENDWKPNFPSRNNTFSSKCSYGKKLLFWKRRRNLFGRREKLHRSIKLMNKNCKQSCSLKNFVWKRRKQIWQHRKTFQNKGQKHIAQCHKLIKKNILAKTLFLLKIYLWTIKMLFWQTAKTILAEGQKFVAQRPELRKKFSKKLLFF